jgi:HD-GYP domain-containing protein (c-di-GMP phosphodiesterase class II)
MSDTSIDATDLAKRLTQIGLALSAEKDPNQLLEYIVIEAMNISHADGGTLYFLDDNDTLSYSIVRNNSLDIAFGGTTGKEALLEPIALTDRSGKPNYSIQAVYAVIKAESINLPDIYQIDHFDLKGTKAFDQAHNYTTKSVLTIPLLSYNDRVLGCLQLINARNEDGRNIPFSQAMQEIVESLASQAAVILDNKILIEEQKALLESFIEMIAQAIDKKSPYIGKYCVQVPALTNMLAEAACNAKEGTFADFNLSDEEKYELHIAGWMHDCGKVTTPVHVMDKARKLETIFDRIELVRTRFELLKRDARIRYLESEDKDKAAYEQEISKIEEDFAFIEKANTGGEFMDDEDVKRLEAISKQLWMDGDRHEPVLTAEELYNLSIRKGTLTDEERTIMEGHMVVTCDMLEALPWPRHLRRVPEYAGGHHERMDGKGYPKGLWAGEMSIPARMMAVADVFEALTAADRPYKPAKKLSETMRIIGFMKEGNHLDPDIVDFLITSKTYLEYAKQFLDPALIDNVDEEAILAITPKPLPWE